MISKAILPAGVITFGHQESQYSVLLVTKKYTALTDVDCSDVCKRFLYRNGTFDWVKDQGGQAKENLSVTVKCKYHYVIEIDAYHAGYIQTVLTQSRQFCKGFLKYVKWKTVAHRGKCIRLPVITNSHISFPKESEKFEVPVQRMVTVCLSPTHKEWIDFKWNYRMSDLVTKRVISEDAMTWLNTLGGGYSALGDYFEHHAREAGRISVKQLKIAMEMGDPPTVIRCRLYYSLSLMQTGNTREAARIIRWQYYAAKRLPVEDHRLLAMCKGIWSRLRFLHKQQKRKKYGQ